MNSVLESPHENALRSRLAGFIPHALVIAGIVLSFVDSRFLMIAGAGFFGPGILQELGWRTADEFRHETRLRASHHAFLLGGVFLTLVVAFNGMGQRYGADLHEIDDAIPASLVLTVMLAAFYLSRLVRYWGPRKAAFRIVTGFTLAFVVLLLLATARLGIGPGGMTWGNLFQCAAFCAVMLGAAFLGRRHPRAAALLLLVPTGWLFLAEGLWTWFTSNSAPWEVALEALIFTLLLPVTGIVAFLVAGREAPEAD